MVLNIKFSFIRTFVSLCNFVTLFGIACVALLLSAKSVHDSLLSLFKVEANYCFLTLAVGLFLLPFTFLRSPEDFWQAIVVAMFTTVGAVALIIVGAALDMNTCMKHSQMPHFVSSNYLLSLGALIFAFGGHASFPTIQHDMKRPSEFTKSTILAFSCKFILVLIFIKNKTNIFSNYKYVYTCVCYVLFNLWGFTSGFGY